MKRQYIRPIAESFSASAEAYLCAGTVKTNELSRFGNQYDPFGNESWVDEGYKPRIPINDHTKEGGWAIEIDPNGTGLDSRGKRSLWDDDEY